MSALTGRPGVLIGGLLGLAALAGWFASFHVMSPAGASMPTETSTGAAAALFMAAWLAMLLAMMLPAVTPMVLAYQRLAAGWPQVGLFLFGYLVVWSLCGLVPMLVNLEWPSLRMSLGDQSWSRVAAGVLLAAGLYQLSPWKSACLRACRSPLGFFLRHTGPPLPLGARHALICVGCCWALMAVMVFVGAMSVAWMAGLTLLFLAEKAWRHGLLLSRAAGGLTVLAGTLVLAGVWTP